ncbi:hypothetical protein GCM10027299_23440 [Larkinella ripae]
MKTVLHTVLFSFLALGLFNCKKADDDALKPTDVNCKLVALDWGNGRKEEYEYNAAGFMTKWTIRYDASDTDPAAVYVYSFKHNSENQIISGTITVDGKIPDKITDLGLGNAIACTWSNGKLTELNDMLGDKMLYTTKVAYDAQGRITQLRCASGNPNEYSFEKTYTYDAAGNCQFELTENDVKLGYDELTYDNTTKSSESLLTRHGLPFDFANLIPWKMHNLKALKTSVYNSKGKLISSKSYQITNVVKNSHNYAVSQVVEGDSTKKVNTFSLSDCE